MTSVAFKQCYLLWNKKMFDIAFWMALIIDIGGGIGEIDLFIIKKIVNAIYRLKKFEKKSK